MQPNSESLHNFKKVKIGSDSTVLIVKHAINLKVLLRDLRLVFERKREEES